MIECNSISFGIFGPPAPVVDNAIAAFDGITGRKIQSRAVTIDDTGNMVLPDGAWFGLGAGKGRVEFDDEAVDEINFLDCRVGIGTAAPLISLDVGSSAGDIGRFWSDSTYASFDICGDSNAANTRALVTFRESITPSTDLGTQKAVIGWAAPNNIFTVGGSSSADFYFNVVTQGAGAGNVGIGTASPDSILHLQGGNPILTLDVTGGKTEGSSMGAIKWEYDVSGEISAAIFGRASGTGEDAAHIGFETKTAAGSLTEKMRLNVDGNLGLGTTTFGTNAAGTMAFLLGTDPTADVTNQFALWGKDQAVGNTAPAIRTENGAVIHLFQALKANYNNWANFSDIVDALVAIGLFDLA